MESIDLKEKKCHLWITGPPNSGKTYFVERLSELGIQIYQGPYNNDWFGFDQDLH
jgi:GTP1/Obg family GTP-binding protein